MAKKEIIETYQIVAAANVETSLVAFTSAAGEKRTITSITSDDNTATVRTRVYKQRELIIDCENAIPVYGIDWLWREIVYETGETCTLAILNNTGGAITINVVLQETIET